MDNEYHKKRGIYCIETVWYGNKDRTSIRPILEILEDHHEAPYLHHDAATRGALFYYLERWKEVNNEYPILYLGFHGESQGQIRLKKIDDTDVIVKSQTLAKRLKGACPGCVVHFSSCSSLKDMDLEDFRETIGASAVSGYEEEVYWFESAAFELLLLYELLHHRGEPLTPTVAMDVKKKLAVKESAQIHYFEMAEHLGFCMDVAPR